MGHLVQGGACEHEKEILPSPFIPSTIWAVYWRAEVCIMGAAHHVNALLTTSVKVPFCAWMADG